MKFDFWTFIFQIINFGVLLWILKRILYRPVRQIMEQRRDQSLKKMEEAEQARKAAQELQQKCQKEQKDLAAQRTRLLEEMKTEVAQQRQRMLAEADQEAQRHIEKGRALYTAEKQRQESEIKERALAVVELFSAKILENVADRQLHLAMIRKLTEELGPFADKLRDQTRTTDELPLEVASAYPLEADEEQALREALGQRLGDRLKLTTTTDRELIAGLKLTSGDRCFDASLRGQLTAFASEARKNL